MEKVIQESRLVTARLEKLQEQFATLIESAKEGWNYVGMVSRRRPRLKEDVTLFMLQLVGFIEARDEAVIEAKQQNRRSRML